MTGVILEILYFDRSTGQKKCRTPFKMEPLPLEKATELGKNFCKKDPESGVQKQIRCLACQCQIEAAGALKDHLKGEKHAKAAEKFVPRPKKVDKTLEDFIRETDHFVLGLEKVEEFVLPTDESAIRLYKCQIFDCDGAFGAAEAFFKHLVSPGHGDNYFKELKFLGHVDQDTRDKHHSIDMTKMVTVSDPERYWIQRNRLPTRKDASHLLAAAAAAAHTTTAAPTSSSIHCSSEAIRGSPANNTPSSTSSSMSVNSSSTSSASAIAAKRKLLDDVEPKSDVKKAKLETKALKAKRPGFTDERYNETSYFFEPNTNLRKVYPYYFTFTTFTKGRWVGERILDVFAREFRAHPAEEYERCIKAGTLTVNYEKVGIDYRLKHNDLLANIVHRHEVPVSAEEIKIVHIDDDLVVVNKPASIPVHPCGRYRHNTVVFILAKEHGLKNLRTIHRLDRLTSGLLLFGRNPKKAREMEQQIRTRQVQKEYVCRVDGEFPQEPIVCKEPIEVVSYKIGVCKVSSSGKDCHTDFQRLSFNGRTSVVLCRPKTGRMHQIRVHLQYLGYPVVNDPLYNHDVFGPEKGKGGRIGKSDDQLIQDLISIHNAENWLGMDDDLPGGGLDPSPITIQPSVAKKRSESPDSAVTDLQSTSSSSPSSLNGEQQPAAVIANEEASNGAAKEEKVTSIATQTGIEEADRGFDNAKLSVDPHCYECKVKYRDPRPKDLVMFLHAWTYSGPEWQYRTELPAWAKEDWVDPEDYEEC